MTSLRYLLLVGCLGGYLMFCWVLIDFVWYVVFSIMISLVLISAL